MEVVIAMPAERFVSLDMSEGVGWIRLDRPDRLNAIGAAVRTQLAAALERAEGDAAIRCVVLSGSGRAFCAGADIREMRPDGGAMRFPDEVGRVLRDEYGPMLLRIRHMPKPVIAAVNGVAAGIGASFAMACDLRIAAEEASFVEAFVGIGLAPDGGATWLLPRLVGMGKALEMFFTGQPMPAREAERLGLVNRVVPAVQLEATVRAMATAMAAGPTGAIAAAKRAVNHAMESGLQDAIDFESRLQQERAASPDFQEGVAAYLEKRSPTFRGA